MKKSLTFYLCLIILVTLLVFSQIKWSIDLPNSRFLVLIENNQLVKELSGKDAQLFLLQLESTKPYFFNNASVTDQPSNPDRLLVMKVEEETYYLYEKDQKTFLMKPYQYTVELPSNLDAILTN
ncbi:TPA: DUF5301 domain-containing protein [Streptococcus suis]|nr:DUF5301 domain-containing protein [Streptococcus suis]